MSVVRALALSATTLLSMVAVSGTGAAEPPVAPVDLSVATFNIFYGGDDLDLSTGDWCAETDGCPATLDQVVAAIERSGADIVGLEEAEGNTSAIAARLGWYANPRTQVIARHPLLDVPGSDLVYVEVSPGAVVAVANVHLPATPEGPYLVRDGGTADEVMALERAVRLPPLEARLPEWSAAVDRGIPVFVVGDFNTPSHLDWTESVAQVRTEVAFPFAWPVSVALEEAGFRDAYRERWPDPVQRPGFTWTPGGPESVEDEVHDRIDWVMVSGDVEVRDARIVGEAASADTTVAVDPFPSDHRMVVADVTVTPARPDQVVAADRRVATLGQPVTARVLDASGKAHSVALVRDEGARIEERGVDDDLRFDTAALVPGTYGFALYDRAGATLAQAPFWIVDPDVGPTVSTAAPSVASGDPIEVAWSGAPGMRWDWIGVYPASADAGEYLGYRYTSALPTGSGVIDETAEWVDGAWPLAPGEYEIRLMRDDGYVVLADPVPFRVDD